MADETLTESSSFRVFGGLEVRLGASRVTAPASAVLQGLLGTLIIARGEPLTVDRLMDLVWADQVREGSRASVHVAVSRLRKWLARFDGTAEPPSISHADGYLLRCPPERSDLGRFLSSLTRARAAAGPDERFQALSDAFRERSGPLLSGVTRISRSDPLVRSLEEEIGQAALDLATTARRTATPGNAVRAVRRLARERPYDEPLHAALIDLLLDADRPAEAQRAYHELAARLSDELGIEPSEKVQRAHMRALSADRPVLATAPMPEPQAAPTPEPRAPLIPAELPPDIADFTGRDREVADLTKVLTEPRPGTVAMASIAGLGGFGKTTLAVHVAHRIADRFPDGQLYVDLRGASADPARPEDVLSRFLFALGVSATGIPDSLEERVALYRSRLAGRRILILLDNVAGEEQVRPLLPGSPGTAVLLTGRVRLVGLEGTHLLELDVLPSAQAMELLTKIIGTERVSDDLDAALEITRLCGRVPLAVRISAARLLGRRQWSLSRLAGVLGEERHRLDELVAGDHDVRAGFEMSYRTLPASAQRAFRLAGLLDAPDFASWAVAALLDVPVRQAARQIEILVDAHLLNLIGTDETGAFRYKFHDLVRLYARERALREDPEPERRAAVQRALGAWLALAEVAAEHVPGPCYAIMHGRAPRWRPPAAVSGPLLADPMAWFGAEHAALVAGVAQACEDRLPQLAWDLAGSMEKYLNVRGLYDGWQRMHEQALALCRETGDRLGEAVLMRGLLEVTTWTAPAGPGPAMTRMRVSASELLDRFTRLDDPVGMSDATVSLAWGMTADGNGAQALALAERALRLSVDADYLGGQARAYHVMAVVHGEEDPQGAVVVLEQAMKVAEALGNARYTTTVIQFLGAAKAFCGDIAVGEKLLEESLAMARRLNDRYLETFSLLYLSKLFAATGDDRARATLDLTLAHSEHGNFGHFLADALSVLGQLDLAEGDPPAAIATLERSVRVWRTRGWIPYLARTLRALGDAHDAAGDHRTARAVWLEARELFGRISAEDGVSTLDDRLAREDCRQS
ncbi:NB-ARC domain-containing protein [Actinomadura madurae]|uniref:AfsR/SARP family transcriptional regulator n=1 Tax=Actinomadura madurae TaxID=1993 RepID=UPI0020262ABB|nr:BTAD domain-containing putative transcriptional regulator [Actinomadura madurae]URN07510.1 NB-ARC domain-containing protein [Actinomadura madurae]